MKKSLVAVFAGLVSAAVFAGMNNVVVTFSTPGVDTYADGTPVVDGECYALVWTPTGSSFGGFNADGSAVGDSKVVIKASLAKGGKCPLVTFQIDDGYREANYPGGTFGVYLLDTRVFETDANGVVLKDAQGKDVVRSVGGAYVKGYGAVATASGSNLADVYVAGPAAAGVVSLADVTIKDISVVGDNVLLTVTGVNAGKFEISSGTTPQALVPEGAERSGDGAAGEMVIIRPKKASGEFFQVNRK